MGNHEFNAITWATTHPETGQPLREHNDQHRNQHSQFLEQLTPEQQAYRVEWFTTIPLWLDLGGIRVVHACWHEASVKAVEDFTGSDRLTTVEHYVAAASKDGALYDAIETLLKGPEISLPDHGMLPYWDHEADLERKKARIRWWDHDAAALPHLAELSGAKLKNRDRYPAYAPGEVKTVDPQFLSYVYKDHVPLFYGHYWRRWENHRDEWTTYTACVDFSAVRGGALVAYRWNGEPEIHWRNYIPHDPAVVAPAPSDQTV